MIIPERYQFTGSSTSGGMGEIYECLDTHLNRHVVLKMLMAGEEERRLLDEQKALMKLRSKHVVQLFDVISVENSNVFTKALILEFIEGRTLGIGDFKPDGLFLNTLWQIACGLKDIHSTNIIHRDIKPNNIRVDSRDVVKILDFGLSRTEGLEAKTMSVIGTPTYMAPELWQAGTISFDQAVDVYAFGVMALALINFPPPSELRAQPPTAIMPGALSSLLSELPDDVIKILEQCLSYQPSNRPMISDVEYVLRRYLLKGRHRALMVMNGKLHELNSKSPNVNLKLGEIGSIGINYDGLRFKITNLSGNVYVNNMIFKVGDDLPVCCVITFGNQGGARNFVTFDVSNPEVMP
jgi:serine/threonine protein kinase